LITGFNDINGSNAGPKFNIAFKKIIIWKDEICFYSRHDCLCYELLWMRPLVGYKYD
jgi:hypothetical protein